MSLSTTTLLAMCLFALSMSISPGPVNMIALSNGVNHGLRKAMPFVSGATLGFTGLLLLVGLGLGNLAQQFPQVMQLLGVAGAAFICYIGYQITRSDSTLEHRQDDSSTFLHGALLQWLNPKAWIACLSGVTAFNLGQLDQLLIFSALYFSICYASVTCWALAGDKISQLLSTVENRRWFNRIMGGVLITVGGYLGVMLVSGA